MQRPQQPIPMYPALNDDETDRQQTQVQQRPQMRQDHEEIPLHNMFNRSVSETPERVRIRQIFNRVRHKFRTFIHFDFLSIWHSPTGINRNLIVEIFLFRGTQIIVIC